MPKHTQLFNANFLEPYLKEFRLSGIPNIYQVREILKRWNDAITTSKIYKQKEEEIKSHFLTEIFGDVLGFSYRNNKKWLYREEVKTILDGKKPDGALGSFHVSGDEIKNYVQIIIEVKDANTDLEKPQNRKDYKISPIDQAFLYASKIGGNCQWVIVTNLTEIRLYHYSSQSAFQRYLIADLMNESILREFMFLFHRDRFYNGSVSSTSKLFALLKLKRAEAIPDKHIIDELFLKLKKLEQLSFINPDFLANTRPFNILDENVWHYENYNLFTLNEEVYTLLSNIKIELGEIKIDPEYEAGLIDKNIVEYREKLDFIFKKLESSYVEKISAIKNLDDLKQKNKSVLGFSYRHSMTVNDNNGVVFELDYPKSKECECVVCAYRSLDYKEMLKRLELQDSKRDSENLDFAYSHYLLGTDNYKKSYNVYVEIINSSVGDDQRFIEYFIAKYNLLNAGHLLSSDPENSEQKKLARSIDLDRVLSEEIAVFADEDVRKILLEIKENKIFNRAVTKSKELLNEIKQLRAFNQRDGGRTMAPNYLNQLSFQYINAFAHIHKNRIIQDIYTPYQELVACMFEGLVCSFLTKENGITDFHEFYIVEAILYIPPNRLTEILEQIDIIPVSEKTKKSLLTKFLAFFKSYYHDGLFGDPIRDSLLEKQLLYHAFRDKFTNIFNNICQVVGYLELDRTIFEPLAEVVVKFVKVDDVSAWWHIKQLGKVLERRGYLFSEKEITELLKVAIDRHRHATNIKYEHLIISACKSLRKFYPKLFIDDTKLVRSGIINCYLDELRADLTPLTELWHILTPRNKKLLSEAFEEYLDGTFNYHLCEYLLKNRVLLHNRKNYLMQLAGEVNKMKGRGFIGVDGGKPKFDDFVCYNFLLIPYILNLSFDLPELNSLKNLSPFELWLQNPERFDYGKFDALWLKAIQNKFIFERLKGNEKIADASNKMLKKNFDKELAKIHFKYFA